MRRKTRREVPLGRTTAAGVGVEASRAVEKTSGVPPVWISDGISEAADEWSLIGGVDAAGEVDRRRREWRRSAAQAPDLGTIGTMAERCI